MPTVSQMLGLTNDCPRCNELRRAKNNDKLFCLIHDPTITDEWRAKIGIPIERKGNAEDSRNG